MQDDGDGSGAGPRKEGGGRLQGAMKSTARPIAMTPATTELANLVDPLDVPLKLLCLLDDDDELFAVDADDAPLPDVDVDEGADDDEVVDDTTKLVTLVAVSKLPFALAYQFVP